MKVVMVTNTFNHHQKPLADNLMKLTNNNFYFIETQPMNDARRKMGWEIKEYPSYVLKSYESNFSKSKSIELIDNADVVIIGMTPYELINKRLKSGKLSFRYSERIYKSKKMYLQIPIRVLKYFIENERYQNIYLLCSSAFAYKDYKISNAFKNRAFKWGYFPEKIIYRDINEIIDKKKSYSILWCARMIKWKHPELAVLLAKKLKEANYTFHLTMIGDGNEYIKIKKMIKELNLFEDITIYKSLTPKQVRKKMEESEIFIFTSDFGEGWGAVLNEAMNSGCAVVASHSIGATPYLINNKKNGLIYINEKLDSLFNNVKQLLDDQSFRRTISKEAYKTIINEWNSEVAAKRLIALSEILLSNKEKKIDNPYKNGICSFAEVLKDNWMK